MSPLYQIYLEQRRRVFTDSRKPIEGGIFFALKGDHFNGNAFARKTLDAGAAYAVVDEDVGEDKRLIKVPDVLKALQDLARENRRHCSAKIIGITGTNGKTTTKELCLHIFSRRFNTLATEGNLNNHIGLPLTLLRLTEETEFAFIEMGANHPGDIKELCSIAEPDAGLITNIGKAHLEGFGSQFGILKTKFELFDYLDAHQGISFYQFNDSLIYSKYTESPLHISYGDSDDCPNAKIRTKLIQELPEIKMKFDNHIFTSSLFGKYNYYNLSSACSLAHYFGVDASIIGEGIAEYVPGNMRSQWTSYRNCKILLDAYNANPTSMQVALEAFARMDAPCKWVILGEMAELGNDAQAEHDHLMEWVIQKEFDQCIFIGEQYHLQKPSRRIQQFQTLQDAKIWLQKNWPDQALMFIKGSRSSAMEQIIR